MLGEGVDDALTVDDDVRLVLPDADVVEESDSVVESVGLGAVKTRLYFTFVQVPTHDVHAQQLEAYCPQMYVSEILGS